MMHGNGSPLGIRKTVQLMVILTILAWATQTLLAQWGLGAEQSPVEATAASSASVQEAPGEAFVPSDRASGNGTLELRGEATIAGADVTLKQVCRWSERDNATFSPIADLVLIKLSPKTSFQAIGIKEIKSLLHDSGVSLATINFVGAATCTIDRSDAPIDEQTALQQWIDAKQGKTTKSIETTETATTGNEQTSATRESPGLSPGLDDAAVTLASNGPTSDPAAPADPGQPAPEFRTLRQVLISDLGARLNVSSDDLQMHFGIKDEKLLALSEPHFRFQVEPLQAKSLGNVNWEITLLSDNSGSQKVSIGATARLWQNQVVLAQPLAMKQVIQETDVIDRRTLVDRLETDAVLTRGQIIGNQATRDLKPGTVMTGKLIDPVPLARTGQFVTVTVVSGSVKVKTVARAMEAGTFGQTIRVKNEATKDIYEVVLSGPQTAEMSGGETPKIASIGVE